MRKDLQCNIAAEPGIFGFVDNTHSPAPDLAQDTVMRDGCAKHALASNSMNPSLEKSTTYHQRKLRRASMSFPPPPATLSTRTHAPPLLASESPGKTKKH